MTLGYDNVGLDKGEPRIVISPIFELFRVTLRYWWVVVGCVLLGSTAGYAYGALKKPVFRAETLLAPASDDSSPLGGGELGRFASQFGGLASIMGIGGGGGTSKEIAIATLNSRQLLEPFVREQNLKGILFAHRYDPATKSYRGGLFSGPPGIDDVLLVFRRDVFEVSEDRRTGLIRVRVDWGDPKQAADWVNDLVARANAETRAEAISDAKRSLEFLQRELAGTNTLSVRDSISRLTETQLNRIMVANVREQYAFRVIDPAVAPGPSSQIRPRRGPAFIAGFAAGCLVAGFVLLALLALELSRRSDGR